MPTPFVASPRRAQKIGRKKCSLSAEQRGMASGTPHRTYSYSHRTPPGKESPAHCSYEVGVFKKGSFPPYLPLDSKRPSMGMLAWAFLGGPNGV